MVSSLQPQEIDFELEWSELRKNLNLAFDAKLPREMYTTQYGRVYRICIAPEPKSTALYYKISSFLAEKADYISNGLNQQVGSDLLESYCQKWASYKRATNEIDNICRYLNLNHIELKRYDSMELQLSADLDDVLLVKDLSYEKWKMKVLSRIDEKLVDACLKFIEKMRMNETLSSEEKNYVKCAINSFYEVCHYKQRNSLQLYQEKFEVRFLSETSKFYNEQARKFLESGDVGNYMTQVLKVLHDEDRRAVEFLDRSTLSKQKQKIEKCLIHDGLEFLFAEATTMVQNENAEQLHKLYQLLKNMETPLARLVKMFKSYVENIGKAKIKEAKTPKEFVDIICVHYENFRLFVHNVFNNEPEIEFRGPEITGAESKLSPDKSFIESLKDAMRTIVNYKESDKERSRAPDILAQYSDQLLKKRGSDDIESKLDEVIICLEFVSEKDLFQGNYTRRLAKRLIFGLSSNTEAERVMIEKLKSVCVYEFSSKIKRMYEDIKNSAIQQEEFNKDYKDSLQDFNMDVKVLQDGCWPFPKVLPNFHVPACLELSVKNYTEFYEKKHNNRRLKWFYNHSHADVRTCATKKMYLLKVTTFQLAILYCFNFNDKLSFNEIRDATALDDKELMKQIKPCVENDVLKISGVYNESNIFLANDDFIKRGTTVKLLPSSQKDKGDSMSEREKISVIQSVEEDRRFWLQACIARVMKKIKQATFNELLALIQKEAGTRFQPTLTLIKKSIEVLLEKSFIERKTDSPDTYLYVA